MSGASTQPVPEQGDTNEDSTTSVDVILKDGFKTLADAIRYSNALPISTDFRLHAINQTFSKILNSETNKILSSMNNILRHNEIDGNFKTRSIEDRTELLIEANDMILEKTANCIDELNGVMKGSVFPVAIQTVSAKLPLNGSWNNVRGTSVLVTSTTGSDSHFDRSLPNSIRLLTAKNIARPQKFFKDKLDNSNRHPWQPRISEKPNSMKPLAIFLEETEFGQAYSHPYEFELDRFTPIPEQLQEEKPILPKPVAETELIEVDTPAQLDELVETLRSKKVFAVDLEHHSYRSFMGITCLMQISTEDKDYLIDTLALRDKLYVLNEVFTKPSIVKVFHGADCDIKWLQRDLCLYVVNMFDTHQAAKVLEYPTLSLAFLLNKFCNFTPNKQFQLADWRIRPLPKELKLYAREDTHYLIYIYQMMKKELLKKAHGGDNLLKGVIRRSTEICKQRYFKPIWTEESHMDFYRKCKKLFDNRQLYALKELYKWRDTISREEDESTGYVLPNHMLLQISETLPREMQGILACCNPIPPLVRTNLLELHQIVLKARDQPAEKAILKEDGRARGATNKASKINLDSALYCPHDLTKSAEFRDDLPTLLHTNDPKSDSYKVKLEVEKSESVYLIFNETDQSDQVSAEEDTINNVTYLGPYERYKLVKPFIQEEEKLNMKKDSEQATDQNLEQKHTDQRIESIRSHFVLLNKRTEEELEEARKREDLSLRETDNSKKRKRDSIEDAQSVDRCDQISHSSSYSEHNQGSNMKKRKYDKDFHSESTYSNRNNQQQHRSNQQNRKNKINKKGRKGKGKPPAQKQHFNTKGNQTSSGDRPNSGKGFSKSKVQEGQIPSSSNTDNRYQNQQKRHEQFAPFNYASVDFRQFHKGASPAKKSGDFRSKNFKAKNKMKQNKGSFNKAFSFRNSRESGKKP